MLPYGIIGNCKTCALIRKDSSIDWMCYPDFSSPSVFAKLLDENKGGTLKINPIGKYKITQKYIPNTAILETTFENKNNLFQTIDFFPRYRKLTKNKYKKLVRQNRLIRIIKLIKGNPKIKVIYEPKPDYALKTHKLVEIDNNLLSSGTDFSLVSNIPYQKIIQQETIELNQTKYIIVGQKDLAEDFNVKRCMVLFHSTKKYWENWCSSLILPKKNKEIIIRSAITLKLLTYSPTGAIIAAPTTSIPEELNSERTWDYRFCWVRDSVFCVDALKKIGRSYEAKKLLNFLINKVLTEKNIQIMYGIKGETKLEEEILGHLSGFKNTKPVRIGNAAFNQTQHDIFGEIIDLMYLYFVYYQYEKPKNKHWHLLKYCIKQIKLNWRQVDSGIWEFRGLKKHYTFSKFMCCLGVESAVKIADFFKRPELVQKWNKIKEEIFSDLIKKGYNQEIKAFTMYYGSNSLDASLLLMAYHEFLNKDDKRLISTIKKIDKNLRHNDLVQRYNIHDDFGMPRSAFTICSFWLIDALYYIGEKEKAHNLFNKLIKKSNHLGLFSEDIDLKTKSLIGNFPQSYTHIALINSAILLSEWGAKRKKIDWNSKGLKLK